MNVIGDSNVKSMLVVSPSTALARISPSLFNSVSKLYPQQVTPYEKSVLLGMLPMSMNLFVVKLSFANSPLYNDPLSLGYWNTLGIDVSSLKLDEFATNLSLLNVDQYIFVTSKSFMVDS